LKKYAHLPEIYVFQEIHFMKKTNSGILIAVIFVLFAVYSCQKDNVTIDAYVPVAADATANASLEELQQGRKLFINNCADCHGLPSPDDYTATDWSSILNHMIPRTGMSQVQGTLVYKYVTRGQ
jgi:mono/diheme cytochrome c family protein